jgi:hypothetical protein
MAARQANDPAGRSFPRECDLPGRLGSSVRTVSNTLRLGTFDDRMRTAAGQVMDASPLTGEVEIEVAALCLIE